MMNYEMQMLLLVLITGALYNSATVWLFFYAALSEI